MAKRVRFYKAKDGEWITPKSRHKLACCDCGLVHDMTFRIVRIEHLNGRKYGKLAIQFKASRNERSTAGRRRGRAVAANLREMAGKARP